MSAKVWFITGTSRGFGREWTTAALERGDKVVATARKLDTLKELANKYSTALVPLELDVTNREAVVAAVDRGYEHFGHLDVVVNNAGYGLFGMIEEVSEAQARAQMDTNFFGALWVTQAALPHLRAQKSGHIIQVSSIGGITAFPYVGLYHASKWALEGFSQSLAQEVRAFGINVTLIEPAGFATDWSGPSASHAEALPAYDALKQAVAEQRKERWQPGDPAATSAALLKIVDADQPPLRAFFGEAPLAMAKADYASRIALWEQWNHVAIEAQGSNAP
jgi:NAD(P)-dependent dehydrogenase (short-subunit alcohol dehydrogenase family)